MSLRDAFPARRGRAAGRVSLRLGLSGGNLFWLMPLSRRELEEKLRVMLETAYSGEVELDLSLVRDGEMSARNETCMNLPGPTNVLAFPLEAEPSDWDGVLRLGGLVLSADALRREVLLYGQRPEEHCLRLLAHGLGHLSGFDHGPEMEAFCAAMEDAARSAR